jgi:hypothetical protein
MEALTMSLNERIRMMIMTGQKGKELTWSKPPS